MDVVVLDYGAGNVASVLKALRAIGATPRVGSDASSLTGAGAVVVPGVGHFAGTASISPEMRAGIVSAIDRGVPFLGICLGLQWLFEGSDEAPEIRGLGLFPGKCFRLAGGGIKVPHVGWNTIVSAARPSRLLGGLAGGTFAYFTHSYAAPVVADTVAETTHGEAFSAMVERERVFGVQFHPEKSGPAGLRVLSNFLAAAGPGGE
jgi:glutamine amidotransferase